MRLIFSSLSAKFVFTVLLLATIGFVYGIVTLDPVTFILAQALAFSLYPIDAFNVARHRNSTSAWLNFLWAVALLLFLVVLAISPTYRCIRSVAVARAYTDRGELHTVTVGSTVIDTRTYDDGGRMLTSVFISDSSDLHATRSDTIGGEMDAT